jgi:hypothetical protein
LGSDGFDWLHWHHWDYDLGCIFFSEGVPWPWVAWRLISDYFSAKMSHFVCESNLVVVIVNNDMERSQEGCSKLNVASDSTGGDLKRADLV